MPFQIAQFSVVILLFFALKTPLVHAVVPFEKACKPSHGLSIKDGMCYCSAIEDFINPWNEDAVTLCSLLTDSQQICLNPQNKYPMKYMGGRCFCPATGEFLGTRLGIDAETPNRFIPFLSGFLNRIPPFVERCQKSYEANGFKPDQKFERARSVKIDSILESSPGEISYLISRLPGKSWNDESDDNALQGDPRDGSNLLGPKLGSFFGFVDYSQYSDRVKIPGVFRINSRILTLNSKLPPDQRIPVKYFPVSGIFPNERYLINFIHQGAIPIGGIEKDGDQTLLLHDTNFHVASWLLMPLPLVKLAQRQSQALFEFWNYFSERYPEKVKEPAFRYYFHRMFLSKASELDSASGQLATLGDVIFQKFVHGHSNIERILRRIPDQMKDTVAEYLFSLVGESVAADEFFANFATHSAIVLFYDENDRNLMFQAIEDFDKSKQSDPSYLETLELVQKPSVQILPGEYDGLRAMIQRLKDLENAIPQGGKAKSKDEQSPTRNKRHRPEAQKTGI